MFTILGADGKEYGPVTAGKLHEWIAGGRANLQTKARRDGETEWKTLADFPEFSQFGTGGGQGAPVTPASPPPITIASMIGSPAAATPAVELELADRGTRLVAQIVDGLTSALACLPGGAVLIFSGGMNGHITNTPGMMAGIGLLGVGVLVLLIVQIYLLSTRGQTVGKKLMSIRIVGDLDETNPGFVKAFLLRVFVNGIIGAIPLLGGVYTLVDICFIFRDDRRCIHDFIAGTKVVKGPTG